MHRLSRDLAFSLLLSLAFAPAGRASTQVATLTCQTAQGSKLTTAVYQFQVADTAYPDGNFSLDISALAPLLAAQSSTPSYATCVLSGGGVSVTMSNVTVSNVNATGLAQGFASTELPMVLPALTSSQLYATANLAYTSLTVPGAGELRAAGSAARLHEKAPAPYNAEALARFRSRLLRGVQSESLTAK